MGREPAELGHSGSFTYTPRPRSAMVPGSASSPDAQQTRRVLTALWGAPALAPGRGRPFSPPLGPEIQSWIQSWGLVLPLAQGSPLLAPAAWEPPREARPLFPGICVGPGRSAITFLKTVVTYT